MPLKKLKRAVKKITRPIAKVLDKVVPNEIKPFLPYAAAVAPFMLPAGGLASLPFASNPAVQRALLSGSIQLGTQLAQEGSEGDFDILPLALAAGSGYLSTPSATEGLQTTQQAAGAQLDKLSAAGADIDAISAASEAMAAPRSLLTQAKDLGITGLQKAGEFMSAPVREGGPGIFSMAGVKAASVPLTGQTTQDAINFAKQAEADYLAELAEFNRMAGEQQEASDADRRSAIIASMTRANFTEDVIDETLDQLGLLLKDGGRVGYQTGGQASLQDFRNALQRAGTGTTMDQQRQIKDFARNVIQREMGAARRCGRFRDFLLQNVGARGAATYGDLYGSPGDPQGPFTGTYQSMKNSLIDQITRQRLNAPQPQLGLTDRDFLPGGGIPGLRSLAEEDAIRRRVLAAQMNESGRTFADGKYANEAEAIADLGLERYNQLFSDGGIASFKEGGIMDLDGKEMDMRGGGFIPIGAKERADDVPARLSKNEFVMTADAVRAAGGGSVNKGAKRMYDLMHNLEARA